MVEGAGFDHRVAETPEGQQVGPDFRVGRTEDVVFRVDQRYFSRADPFIDRIVLNRKIGGDDQLAHVVKQAGNESVVDAIPVLVFQGRNFPRAGGHRESMRAQGVERETLDFQLLVFGKDVQHQNHRLQHVQPEQRGGLGGTGYVFPESEKGGIDQLQDLDAHRHVFFHGLPDALDGWVRRFQFVHHRVVQVGQTGQVLDLRDDFHKITHRNHFPKGDGAGNRCFDRSQAVGFFQDLMRGARQFVRQFGARLAGKKKAHRIGMPFLHFREEPIACHFRHVQVRDDNVERRVVHQGQSFFGAVSDGDGAVGDGGF